MTECIRVETETLTNYRNVLSSESVPHMDRTVNDKQELICGYEPQMGLDTKTD
jgi:hypothetical protein